MTRAFFDQVDDELRGLLGPGLRDYRSQRNSRLIKFWYGDPAVHFEAQIVSARWGPRRKPVVEIGLHLEGVSREQNQDLLERLIAPKAWRRKFPDAEHGKAFGPRGADWRRLSETIDAAEIEDPDFASEVAGRLADYARTFLPAIGGGDSKRQRKRGP